MFDLKSVIAAAAMLLAATLDAAAQAPEAWLSPAVDRALPISFHPASERPSPLIVRLRNVPGVAATGPSRVEWMERGYAVLEVDYQNEATAAPHALARDVLGLRDFAVRALAPRHIDPNRIFVVPESHDVAADQMFFRQNGFSYRMDIVYPVQAGASAAVLQVSHRVEGRRDARAFLSFDDAILDVLALEGYAVALADHHGADAPSLRLDRMPLHVRHGRAALRHLRAQADQYGIDTERLAVLGFSKGGASAARLAATQGERRFAWGGGAPNVRAAVVIGAYLDQAQLIADGIDAHSSRWRDSVAAWGDPSRQPARWDAASAITYVDRGDPPMLLLAGADDSYRPAQAARMASALAQNGVTHELYIEPALDHRVPTTPSTVARIIAFLREHLR